MPTVDQMIRSTAKGLGSIPFPDAVEGAHWCYPLEEIAVVPLRVRLSRRGTGPGRCAAMGGEPLARSMTGFLSQARRQPAAATWSCAGLRRGAGPGYPVRQHV